MNCCHIAQSFVIVCVGCCLMTGCATLNSSADVLLGPSRKLSESDVPPPPDVPSFMVELHTGDDEPERYKLPLTEDLAYVQQVLKKSGAVRRFGRVKMELWRKRDDGNGYVKLDVPFDRKQREVPRGYDYALRPDDRLMILKDTSTILDDMLESVSGPVRAVRR